MQMKGFIIFTLAFACACSTTKRCLSQGLIDFRNRVPNVLDAPIFDVDGGRVHHQNIVAELYWAPVGSTTFTIAKAADNVSAAIPASVMNSGAGAGYWIANGDRAVGVASGVLVQLQVRIWDSTKGSFAQAQSGGQYWDASSIFTIAAGDPGGTGSPPSLPNPAVMIGLRSFGVPEPSTFALGILGAGVLLLNRNRSQKN